MSATRPSAPPSKNPRERSRASISATDPNSSTGPYANLSAVRGVVVAITALALAPAGHAATLKMSTTAFSPTAGPMTIEGSTGVTKQLGVRLTDVRGRPLGWLDRPQVRSDLLVVWDGRLNGKH